MAIPSFGTLSAVRGVDTDSDAVLNIRLSTVLQKLEALHTGSVLSWIGGPTPERGVHFTGGDLDVCMTLQVREGAIRASIPLENAVCLEFVGQRRLYTERYEEFISDRHHAPKTDVVVVKGYENGPYREELFQLTYNSAGPGRENKTMEFATQYAGHLARYLDRLLDVNIEEPLADDEREPKRRRAV